MNRETIIRLAREAGAVFPSDGSWHKFEVEGSLERFAALVVANNPPQSWMSYQEGYEAGQQAERQRIVDMLLDMHAKEERHNYYGFIARMIKESA